MEGMESVVRAALDTLSSQVAVLDADGQILFTNSAWGSVGESADSGGAVTAEGANYFASVDPEGDDFAADAVAGIQSVLSGDREVFTLEYPCHTPDEQRWFLMRATPFALDGQQFVTVAHIDITDRRLAEIDATENAQRAERERERLEHLVERINGLVQDITRLLVRAVSREEIAEAVCERLAATDPYVAVWISDTAVTADSPTPTAVAGDVDATAVDGHLGTGTGGPSTHALEDGAVRVVESVGDATGVDELDGLAGVESLIAIPLRSRESTYGVLTICSDQQEAFDERERAVLEALGRATATAIDAVQRKRTLTTNHIVEMEVTIEDDSLFPCRLSTATESSITYSGSVYQSDGLLQEFYGVDETDRDTVAAVAASDAAVTDHRVLSDHENGLLVQFTLSHSLVDTLADRGAVTQELTADGGIARCTFELPHDADARAVFELLSERYDRTDLVGYHEHERPVQTRQEFRTDLEDTLTDRQRTALRTAYYSGFFDWPRDVDGSELAEMMGISRSTFHQHLRVAERKVFDAFFDA